MKARIRSLLRVPSSFAAMTAALVLAGILPAPAQFERTVQIGANKVGSVTDNGGGSFSIVGGGNDIWDTRDEFTYACTEIIGDFDLLVRVESLQANSAFTKAGLMIRESLSEYSKNAFLRVTPNGAGGNGTYLAYRTGLDNNAGLNGGQHEDRDGANSVPNNNIPNLWLRLVRIGNTILSSNSIDGVTWQFVASQNTATWGGGALPASAFVGLAVCRNGGGPSAAAEFRNLQFSYSAALQIAGASSRGNPTGIRVSASQAVPLPTALSPAIYTLTSPAAGTIVTGMRFVTANDAPERDPMTFTLEGTTGDPTSGPWTLIASANTGLPNVRRAVGPDVRFTNTAAYTSYRLRFPTVRDSGVATSMQISEVSFLDAAGNDVTSPGDPVIPSSPNHPGAEAAAMAIDNNANTKYLNTDELNAGFNVTPSRVPPRVTVITGARFTSANDAAERDPMTFTIEGRTGGDDTPWALIVSGNTGLSTTRGTPGPIVSFANSIPYSSYRVLFPTLRTEASANSMQLGEIELLNAGNTDVTSPTDVVVGVRAIAGGGASEVALVGTAANANNYPAAESPDKTVDNNAGSKYLNFAKLNTGVIITPSGGSTPTATVIAVAVVPGRPDQVQLTTTGLAEGASYVLTVPPLPGVNPVVFVHGAAYEGRRIRISHNKSDNDAGRMAYYFNESDAVRNGIGDIGSMVNGGTYVAVEGNTVFEDPIVDTGENERFSSRISGVLNVTATGNHTFAASSDDTGFLYLSSNDDPGSKVAIAKEPIWNGSRQYAVADRRSSGDCGGTAGCNVSAPLGLTAGNRYYLEYVFVEGGGGNNGSAAWAPPGSPLPIANNASPIPQTAFVPSRLVNGNVFYRLGTVSLVQNPGTLSVPTPNPATFSVRADGTPDYRYQWQRKGPSDPGFSNLPGARSRTYTLAATDINLDNGAQYRVVVDNEFSSATSAVANLTVTIDLAPPTLVSCVNVAGSATSFDLLFSEPVNTADAQNLANYSISGGVTLNTATLQGDLRTVRFTCTSLASFTCKTLTVSNIRDRSNQANAITANSPIGVIYSTRDVLVHRFDNVTGGLVEDLLNNASFPNSPTVTATVGLMEYSPNLENYGARMMALLTPQVTGNYTFYISSDDASALWLSTDISPANKVRIANEPIWAGSRQWTGPASGGGRLCPSTNACNISVPISLQGGCKYYMEMIYKEGGGGDYGAVAWQTPASGPSPGVPAIGSTPIPGTYLSAFLMPATVVTDIANVTTACGTRVTFNPVLIGTPPFTLQWFSNGVAIPGANSMSFTTATLTTADTGVRYRLEGTTASPAGVATTTEAVITVNAAGPVPQLLSVTGTPSFDTVTLVFNKILDPSSAVDSISYTIAQSGGGAVGFINLTLQPDGRTVVINTTPLLPNTIYNVSVNGNLLDFCGASFADATLSFRSHVVACGGLAWESFNTGGGVAVADLTNNVNFPNNPDGRRVMNTFDTRAELATDNFRDNFGARLRGVFIPPSSGNWIFYLHSDDASQLYINPTGPNPAGKVPIAQENGCCNDWPTIASAPINLTAGTACYIEGLYKEGGGGDYIRVAARRQGSSDALVAIPIEQLGRIAAPGAAGTLTISPQPASVTRPENSPVTFTVGATAQFNYLNICYQWQRQDPGGSFFFDIPGATSTSVTVDPTTFAADNGAQYRCIVSIVGVQTASAAATLTLTPDTTGPSLLSAAGTDSFDQVTLLFNERLDIATATTAANYSIPGISVLGAALGGDQRTVTLTTTLQTDNRLYTAIVTGVRDRIGNSITTSNFASFISFVISCSGPLMETYDTASVGGTAVSLLTSHPNFPNNVRDRYILSAFDSRGGYADDTHEQYGGRIRALFVPPVSGDWVFYLRSDDASQLFLNPAGTGSASKQLITEETGCCGGFAAHGSGAFTLVAGQKYYLEALWKEGGGGDYCQVAAKLLSDPTNPDTLTPIPGSSLRNPALPAGYGGAINITQQPVSVTTAESSPATFAVMANTSGGYPLCYQWQRRNAGAPTFTNIPGAMGASYTLPAATLPNDQLAQFRCVIGVIGTSTASSAATLSVTPDTTRPAIVSVGSMLGAQIGVCFSEPVEVASAQDAENYRVNGGTVAVSSATLRPDGRSVLLVVSGLGSASGTPFTVGATGILDRALAPNSSSTAASSQVLGLASADIGNPGDPQSPSQFFACSVEVTTGGSDIWNNQDGFHFDYRPRTGNFDVQVRVESLVAANPWSKAGLMARETTAAGSRNLSAIVDPPPVPTLDGSGTGVNSYEANFRDVTDMATAGWPGGVSAAAPAYPNAWIRLTRYNNVFTAYRSTDGVNWTQMAQTTQTYPQTILVGLCTTAHSLSFLTTAVYQNLAFVPEPAITQQPVGGTFQCAANVTLSVTATGAGPLAYQWRKGGVDLGGATASTLNFNPAAMANNGAYSVVVSGAGGSVTSSVANVLISDTVAPTIACGANQTVPCGTPWSFATATANDACDPAPILTVLNTTTNITCGINFVASRVWRAVDASANTSFCTQSVTVVDTIAPIASCPANITRYCNGGAGAQVSYVSTGVDACHGSLVPVCTPPSGSFFAVGSNNVRCVAIDPCGNSNSCSFSVFVLPNSAPAWSTVASYSATTTPSQPRSLRSLALSQDEATLFLGLIEGPDSASIRSVSAVTGTIISNVVLDPGRQTHAIATDDRGYIYAGASIPSGTPDGQFQIYNGTNLALVNVLTPSGTARVGGLSIRRVGGNVFLYVARQSSTTASIQRFNVTDPMLVSFDLSFGTSGSFDVRSLFPAAANLRGVEVADDGTIYVADGDNGVVYKINSSLAAGISGAVAKATDVALYGDKIYVTKHDGASSGIAVLRSADMSLATTLLTGVARENFEGYSGIDVSFEGRLYVGDQVYSNTPPTVVQDRILASSPMATNLSLSCPAPLALECGTAIPPGAVTQGQFEALGGIVPCQSVSISFSDAPLSPGPLTGVVARTYMAVDSFGNNASCVQNIRILDTIAPAITCPASIASNITTIAGTVINYTTPTATDACGPAPSVLCVPATGSLFPIGVTTVTCTATDATGRSTPCNFSVAVRFCHSTNYTVNASVPDNSINGLASTRSFISPIGVMTDVNVSLVTTGGFNGDLYAYLVHESGFSVLLNRVGRTGTSPLGYGDAGFNVTFDDQAAADVHLYRFTLNGNNATPLAGPLTNSWQPDARSADPFLVLDTDARSQYLTNFNGLNANGDWTLFVADLSGVDIATVSSWGLEICGYPPVALAITAQSSNTTAQCSSNVTFSVTTTGTAPKTNQWYRQTTAIAGATASTLTLTNVHPVDMANYSVIICNMAGCITSSPIALTVIDTNPPLITLCATNQTNCAGISGTVAVPNFVPSVTAIDACSSVTVTQSPAAGTLVAIGNTIVTLTARDTANNSNGCTVALTVSGPPVIASQPQNQTTPMGNGAIFSVTASSVLGAPAYQWVTNGVNVGGGTASSLALSNLSLADNGMLVRVIVSNCAGSVTSSVAVLSVTVQSGIAFDFNVPGQFTNTPYAMAMNNWVNSALPALVFESPTGGVGTAVGGGALDLTVGGGDNGSTLMALTYDFSLPGRALYASAMIRLKAPTSNGRTIQLGFMTETNVNNAWQQVSANSGQGFMSVILQSTTQPALTYSLRSQFKITNGTATVETTPVNTPTNVLTAGWYKLVARFVNVKDTAPGSLASSNFTVEATLQSMGADGLTAGAVVLGMSPQLQTNVDLVNASRLRFCVRSAAETGGSDFWDNIYVHTTNGPAYFVAAPRSQAVAAGRTVVLQGLVDGDGPYTYQWQRTNGAGGFTNVPGAQSWNLRTAPVPTGGTAYRVVVNGTLTSGAAVLTATADALDIVSVGSIDGSAVGIQFDQAVDPVSGSNPANYLINGTPAYAARVYQSPTDLSGIVADGTRVLVTPASMFGGSYTVSVSGVGAVSGAAAGVMSGAGTIAGLTGEDVNPYVTQPAGQQYSFGPGQFEITGGGQDISGVSDSFRYVYKQVTGDFDVKARVPFMDVVRTSTKAGFDVRTSLDPFAPSVLASVISQLPARNLAEGVVRQVPNTASATWGTSVAHAAGFPNVWLRLRRVGNTFIRYSSTNGTDWRFEAQVSPVPALPATVYYGVAVCGTVGANVGVAATVWMDNYGETVGSPGSTINITQQPLNVTTGAPNAALLTVVATLTGGPASELAYLWQRTNGSGGWTNMPVLGGTNNVLTTSPLFGSDSGAQFRVVVSAPGALSVTSSVATVMVTDGALPTITAAHIPTNATRNIIVIYSEPMGASALSLASYSVTNGPGTVFGVAGAVFLNGDTRVVQLTTALDMPLGSYGVVVSGVQDLNGNPIAANTVRLLYQMGYGQTAPFVAELYGGLTGGGAITDLVNNVKFAGGDARWSYPELINYSNVFGINGGATAFPDTLNTYGVRMYSWFVPPASGAYKFYVRGDDFVQFWMNTNPATSTLPPDGVIASSNSIPPTAFNSPVAQQAMFAIDNNINTKYLNFNLGNPGLVVMPAMGASVVTGVRFTTAEDAIERDPITFTLEGTSGDPGIGPWTLIASGNTGLATNRLTVGPVVGFGNGTAYTAYRVLFPAMRFTGNSGVPTTPNSMQIAEIELLDGGGQDVTGRGALRQVELGAANAAYTLPNSVTNTLVGGQRYFVEMRFKETGGGDGGTVAVRTDNTVPAATETAPGTMFQLPTPHVAPAPVQIELYAGLITANPIGNGRIEDLWDALTLPTVIAGVPTVTGFGKHFGFSTNLANASFDNYLGKVYAHYIAPSNGLYKFYMHSDDSAQLWMNTNGVNSTDPAGMQLLGYLERSLGVNYWLVAENVSLVGGQRYYMEGRWREGTGGDGIGVVVRAQGDAITPFSRDVIPPSQLELATNSLRYGPVRVAITPLNPTVRVGEQVVFQAVGISGTPPYGIQWLRNGVPIMTGNPIFTNAPVTLADVGAVYTLVVTNLFSRAEANSVLNVMADNAAPTLVSAVGSQYQEFVTVTFDGPLDPTSAACLSGYRINNGVSVLGVAYDSGRGNRVSLRTSPQTPGTVYTVTVNGVKDRAGNLIGANSTINYTAWTWGGCGFLVELFTNITGAAVANLTADSKYGNNLPDVAYYTNVFGAGRFGAESGLNNYGARISTYAMAPSNGLYRFYVRGDDGTMLFMNTNGPDARGRVLVARNDGANSGTYANGTGNGLANQSGSPVVRLTNGTPYYLEALLKEGGGGDHVEVVFRAVDPGTLADVPALAAPVVADLNPALAGFFVAPGNPDRVQFVVSQSPPSDLFVMENERVDLRLVATVVPPDALLATCYQWQRETAAGSGVYTNIPGATAPSLVFGALLSQNNVKFRLQAGLPAPRVFTTTLHVMSDGAGPRLVSASSLDGTSVHLCFNEPISRAGGSAEDLAQYVVTSSTGAQGATSAILRTNDERTVILGLGTPITGRFVVQAGAVGGLEDLVGNFGDSSATGAVQNLLPADVGGPPAPGNSFSCKEGEIDVVAGGADIWGTSDQGHMVLRPVCGDFDIWTRVQRLDRSPLDNDNITKSGLMVRENWNPDARKMHVLLEPPALQGGRGVLEAGQRPAVANATAAWGGGSGNTLIMAPAGIPNGWVRIKRTGNRFEAFRSQDGVSWTLATTNNMTMSNVVYVGLAATAHVPYTGGAAGSPFGNAYVTPTGGIGDSGVLHLTDPVNDQIGSFILNEQTPGKAVRSFTSSFGLQIGSGSADGADGLSFSLAADLPNAATSTTTAEDGIGSGLAIAFDNYVGGTVPAGPAIRIKWNGAFVAHQQIPKWNSPNFIPVTVNLDADGTVDVVVDGTNVFSNVATPYVPVTGRFGVFARTGGLNQRHWIDNFTNFLTTVDSTTASYFADFNGGASIATSFTEFRDLHMPLPPTILVAPAPADQTVGVLTPVTWTVTASNPPNAGPIRYQWQLNGNNIAGATGPSYSIASASVAQAGLYSVLVGNDGGCVMANVTLNVLNGAPVVTGEMLMATQNVVRTVTTGSLVGNDTDPEFQALSVVGVSGTVPGLFSANFNDGQVPAGSELFGAPFGPPNGTRVADDGTGTNQCIHLVDTGTLSGFGTYNIPDLAGGKRVNALQARWRSRIGGASAGGIQNNRPGADGMSFSWAADLPTVPVNGPFYEDGSGTGLSVTVDTWDGGVAIERGGIGIGIEIAWRNERVAFDYISADAGLAKDFLRKDRFVDVSLTVTPEGLATFTYDGMTLSAQLPNYAGIAGGRYMFGSHTGSAYDNHWVDDVWILALTGDTSLTGPGAPITAFNANFNSVLQGALLFGNAYLEPVTGTASSGALHLTDAVNNQAGACVLNDLAQGRAVNSFTATFDLQIGSGSPDGADGFSFNLAGDLPNAVSLAAEDGAGGGLSICVDNYVGGTVPAGPAIRVKYAGVFLGSVQIPKWNSPNYIPVSIRMDADGTVDVVVDGTNVFSNFPTPYQPVVGRFGLHARTGGLNQRHWVDNLAISGTALDYGRVSLAGGVVTYAPPTNGCGMDRYYYVVSDGQQGGLSVGQVDVQVKESVAMAPVIAMCVTNRTVGLTNACTLMAPDLRGQLLASDNCCCLLYTQTPAPGTVLPLGSHLFTFVATDTMNLSATCTATVVVQDIAPPTIVCAPNITARCIGMSTPVTFTVTASDLCTASPGVLCVPPSGFGFPVGATTVNCTATDGSGNTNLCSFVVNAAPFLTNYLANASIPDNNPLGVASTKTVATDIGILTDVNVSLTITGGYNGDLYAYLVHNSGYSVLLNRVGRRTGAPLGYGDTGFNVTIDDQATNDIHNYRFTLFGNQVTPLAGALTNQWTPDGRATDPGLVLDTDPRTELLTSFNGLNPNGDWTLYLADLSPLDSSTLVSWGLELCGLPPIPPSITLQPQGQTVPCSSSYTFTSMATGTAPLTNRWFRNGTLVPGANGSSLVLNPVSILNAGTYQLVVSGMGGSVTSAPAVLVVTDAPPVLSCPSVVTAECMTPAGALVTFSPTVSDVCTPGITPVCVPASGTLFPPGPTMVNCTATDIAANVANCSFTVNVVDTTPPAFCVGPPTIGSAGVTDDNFTGVDAASPSSNLLVRLTGLDLQDFDEDVTDAWLGHTFTNLPANVSQIRLRVRLRAVGGLPDNDTIILGLVGPGGSLMNPNWSRRFGSSPGDPGLLGTPWTVGLTNEFVLNLGALPNRVGPPTDILPLVRQLRYLDVMVQDDSVVDYVVIEVTSCQCGPDIVVNTLPGACTAVATYPTPAFTDNCDLTTPTVCSPPSGSAFPIGTTQVSCTAADDSGNVGSCHFNVTVNDQAPVLNIARQGGNAVVCWPVSCAAYILESSPSLTAPITWTPVGIGPAVNGNQLCVTIPIQPGHKFFRLRKL